MCNYWERYAESLSHRQTLRRLLVHLAMTGRLIIIYCRVIIIIYYIFALFTDMHQHKSIL